MDKIDRINQMLEMLDISQREFGRKIGISQGYLNRILNRKVKPKPRILFLMEKALDVPHEWLESGEGGWQPDVKLEKLKRQVIGQLEVLNETQLQMVIDYFEHLKKYKIFPEDESRS